MPFQRISHGIRTLVLLVLTKVIGIYLEFHSRTVRVETVHVRSRAAWKTFKRWCTIMAWVKEPLDRVLWPFTQSRTWQSLLNTCPISRSRKEEPCSNEQDALNTYFFQQFTLARVKNRTFVVSWCPSWKYSSWRSRWLTLSGSVANGDDRFLAPPPSAVTIFLVIRFQLKWAKVGREAISQHSDILRDKLNKCIMILVAECVTVISSSNMLFVNLKFSKPFLLARPRVCAVLLNSCLSPLGTHAKLDKQRRPSGETDSTDQRICPSWL